MNRYFPAWLRVPTFFFAGFMLIEYFIESGDRPAFVKYPIVSVVLLVYLVVLIGIEFIWSAVANLQDKLMTAEERAEAERLAELPIKQQLWFKSLMKRLTKSEPIESEAALLLNHDYDGIRELDNKLPPWWVYSFYATIIFGAIYLGRFHFFGGDDQETELRKEIAQAQIDVEEYKKTAPDLMDESKVTQLTDKASLAKGKEIFTTNCAACHRADGGGQIGPNLTDDYWILGGGIKKVFHTITNGGRDGKGMVAWKTNLKPTEIQHVASYVLSLGEQKS